MAEFEPAVAIVLKHEAGFQLDPNDSGNWTTGIVGHGELKGTNHGISAASYPAEDIRHMTEERAKEIYLRDYWTDGKYHLFTSQDVANKMMDLVVTMQGRGSIGSGIRLLQEAINELLPPDQPRLIHDGILGPKTMAAANSMDGADLLATLKGRAVARYQQIAELYPLQARYLDGWTMRALS